MSWGRKPSCTCGSCRKCKQRDYMRRYYQSKTPEERKRLFVAGRDPERVRRQDRERHARFRDDPAYNRRRAAVLALNGAIQRGEIQRQSCEVCGAPDACGHHDDYDRPLDVRWLCYQHHADEHMQVHHASSFR